MKFGNQMSLKFTHLLSGMVVLFVCSWASASTVVVRFGSGETITSDDLTTYFERRLDLKTLARSGWGKQKAVTEATMTRALVLEGLRLGESRNESSADERFDENYALTVYRKITPVCQKPEDEAAAKQFFEQHPEAFRIPVQARLSRIMVPVTSRIDGLSASAWMYGRAQAIASAEVSFATVAEQAQGVHKLDAQGDLGWVLVPPESHLMRAIASAQPGELVGPANEAGFVYLFNVVGRRDARQPTWNEVAAQAATRAQEVCREENQQKVQAELFKRYGVEIDMKGLTTPDGKPASQ